MKKSLATFLLLVVGQVFFSCTNESLAPAPVSVASPVPVASEITDESFTVSWESVEGAVSYTYSLQHRNSNGAITQIVPETDTDELSVSFTELKASTEYVFLIKATGDGETTLDSDRAELAVSTVQPAYLSGGAWIEIDEVTYQKHNYMPSYCFINVTFKPNDKTVTYYATVMNGSYFDDEPDNPDFEPNTEEDLKEYLLSSTPVSDDKIREQNYWDREVIVGMIGVDAQGNAGKLNWTKVKIPSKSEFLGGGDDRQSEASLRIQHVVINSGELEGAPAGCFATVYRFELTNEAKSFRYEDGYYAGDFSAHGPDIWKDYFMSIANAYGEGYDGYYSGWKSSAGLESTDGFYYYDATFWDASMAGESFEVIYIAFDSDAVPGAPGCYTVTLPKELPEISGAEGNDAGAAVAAAGKIAGKPRTALRSNWTY